MHAVYLDQNYLATMAKARLGLIADVAKSAPAEELRQRLDELVGGGAIVCPFSEFHVWETSLYENAEVRAEMIKMVGAWSLGRCVVHPQHRLREELRRVVGREADPSHESGSRTGLGFGADCYPGEGVDKDARTYLASIAPQAVFCVLVESLRGDNSFASKLCEARDATLKREAEVRTENREPAPDLDLATDVQINAYLSTPEIQELIQVVLAEAPEGSASLPEPFDARTLRALPTLATMVLLRARKETDPLMKAQPGDFLDAGHASALSAVDVLALDGKTANLLKPAAKALGRRVVGNVKALHEALDELA